VALKERAPLLHGQEPFHAPRELVRRDDDGERAERIVLFQRVDFSDESVFEIGMERTGDDREHDGSSLTENREGHKNGCHLLHAAVSH